MERELPKLDSKITHEQSKNEELRQMSSRLDLPTVDDYLRLKILEEKDKARQKVEERKANLRRLQMRRSKSAINLRTSAEGQIEDKNKKEPSTGQQKIIKGKTFNIEFKLVDD